MSRQTILSQIPENLHDQLIDEVGELVKEKENKILKTLPKGLQEILEILPQNLRDELIKTLESLIKERTKDQIIEDLSGLLKAKKDSSKKATDKQVEDVLKSIM